MTTPTEEDVRAAIARSWTIDKNPLTLMVAPSVAIQELASLFRGLADAVNDWDDMRQSEIDRLDAIMGEELAPVMALVDAWSRAAVEATVRAERRFFQEHPDAPWRDWPALTV